MLICILLGTSMLLAQNQQGNTGDQDKKLDYVVVITRGGVHYNGYILYVTDSLLVIWQSNEPYNRDQLERFAQVVPYFNMEQVVIKKEGKFLSGLGTGFLGGGLLGAVIGLASGNDESGFLRFTAGQKALLLGLTFGVGGGLIGGAIGATQGIGDDFNVAGNKEIYILIVPRFKKNSIFPGAPPPELYDFIMQKKEELTAPYVQPAVQTAEKHLKTSIARFHISAGSVLVMTPANNDIITAFNSSGFGGTVSNWLFGGTTDYPVDHSNLLTWNLGMEYNLSDHLRLGLARNNIPQQEVTGIDSESEYARGTSYSILIGYVPHPVAPLFLSRFEFAIAAGIDYNSLSVNGTLNALFGSAIINRPVSFKVTGHNLGVQLSSSIDYYFSKDFSLQLKCAGRIMPSLDIAEVNYTNPNNNEMKTLQAHTVHFSAVDLSVGVRFHF
jgi:hypothetical protein